MTAPQPPKTYGDRRLTAQQISDMPSDQQQQYLEQGMSPAEMHEYLQDKYNAQFGYALVPFGNLVARTAAMQEGAEYDQQTVQQATSSDTQYISGLSQSNHNYKAVDHPTLQGYVDNGLDAGQIGEMSNGYHEMSSTFDQIATTLSDAVDKSQSEWQGEAADSARGYLTGLQQWSDGNSQNARLASEVTYQQSTAAQTAKNSMPAPIPFSWTDEIKGWFSNPLDIGDSISASVAKQKQSQDAHDQAVQVMSDYDNNLYSAASKQPVFTEPPKFQPSSGVDTPQLPGSVGSTLPSGYTGPTGGSFGGGGGGLTTPASTGDAGSASGLVSSLGGSLSAGPRTGSANGDTSAQGFQPGPGAGSGPSANNGSTPPNALGGMPPMAPPMMGGMGGDEDYSTKVGRGGGVGGGGGAFGSRGGAGAGAGGGALGGGAAGEGARTGLRAGGAGAAEAAGASGGARGATGRPGTSGMGGLGGHGKGEGSEDEEHQRPSWLVEADPDDIFGTSERTAPPVIGE